MPIYEYECNACGDRHEFIQKFSESPKRKCPSCGERRLKRLISAAAFHLKGDGWYVTDFRDKDKKKKKANGEEKKAGAETKESKSETKSESKSESKSEAAASGSSEGKSKSGKGKTSSAD